MQLTEEAKVKLDSFLNKHYFGEEGHLVDAYNEGWADCSKWKGEQLKAWLEEKKKQKPPQYNYCTKKCQNTEYHNVIDELINDLFGGGQKEDKAGEDLCKTCSHLWSDFPLPLDRYIAHCEIADRKRGFKPLDELVEYPCVKCPFDSYEPKNKENINVK